MKMITINKASVADLPAICELADIIWREHYTPIIGTEQVAYMLGKYQSLQAMAKQISEGVYYYSILLEGNLVGYLSFYCKGDSVFLSKIYVLSSNRGKGVGREAMLFVTEQARQRGLKNIRLTVNKYNYGSIEAYKSMGFKIVDDVIIDIGDGYVMDDFVMELFITDH